MREGLCGEWRSRWTVQQEESGLWIGTSEQVHIGGPCAPGTGETHRTEVQASIAGEAFFAARRSGGAVCTYYGRIQHDRVRGIELCEGTGTKMIFALRFPEDGGVSGRGDGRDDRFLDDPQTFDPNRPPPGFNFRFRATPGR